MEFDIEKLKMYYQNLLAQKQASLDVALDNKEVIVEQRVNAERERISKEVEEELLAKAVEPYQHDIELCESFLINDNKEEQQQSYTETQQ